RRAADEGPVLAGQHPDSSWTSKPALPDMPREAILLGDFNFTEDNPAYAAVAGEFSPRFGYLPRRDGFVDAWAARNRPAGDTTRQPAGCTILGPKEERRS